MIARGALARLDFKRGAAVWGVCLLAGLAGCGGGGASSDASSSSATPGQTGTSNTATSPSTSTTSPPAPVAQVPPDRAYPGNYDLAFGRFAPLSQAGRGDSVIALPAGLKGGVVTAKHSGSSNFIVTVVDASNATVDGLVNEIGAYSGSTLIEPDRGQTPARLTIKANGQWTIDVKPVGDSPRWGASNSSKGDAVYLYEFGPGVWAFSHDGKSNFIVGAVGNGDGGLINEIGPYTGTVAMSKGPAVISIEADGTWSATKQ